jgi:hypothetical protein
MKILPIIALLAVSFTASTQLNAEAEVMPEAAAPSSLIVAELFTSQSCSSCPPAEKLFSSLADEENILTIEWHVDIWDSLIHGGSRWKDPYSDKKFTARQRSYNRAIRGQNGIYTPQAVINGKLEGVGSRSGEVSHMLENTKALPINIYIEDNKVVVPASDQPADVVFVRLLKEHQTDVKGGENKGRQLAGKNIALGASVLGKTGRKIASYELPAIKSGETCAVIVQNMDGSAGPILGAVKCG